MSLSRPSEGGEDPARGEEVPTAGSEGLPPSAGLEWKHWPGSVVPAFMANIAETAKRGKKRRFVGILTVTGGGRASVVLRVEERGQVVAVLGREDRRGVRTPEEGKEWAEKALAVLAGDLVGAGEHPMESDPSVSEFQHPEPAAGMPGSLTRHRSDQASRRAGRSGRRADSDGDGMHRRSRAPVPARPQTPDRREAEATPEAWAGTPSAPSGAGLVNLAIFSQKRLSEVGYGMMKPNQAKENGEGEAGAIIHNSGGPAAEAREANYTLHILCDVIDIPLEANWLECCE